MSSRYSSLGRRDYDQHQIAMLMAVRRYLQAEKRERHVENCGAYRIETIKTERAVRYFLR